jgi:hypothetical protein
MTDPSRAGQRELLGSVHLVRTVDRCVGQQAPRPAFR